MERKKFISICAVVLMLSALGFFLIYNSSQNSNEQQQDDYLSFTVYDSKVIDKIEGTICKYNLQSKEVSDIFRFPLTSMYALGVYDENTNSVYYSRQRGNDSPERKRKGGDQIYVHNLETGSDIMLTDDLIAVNFMIPVDDMLFFLAARQPNSNNMIFGKIDLSDGSIQYWDEGDTASSRILSIDRVAKRVYVAIYDAEEYYESVILAQSGIPTTHTICSYDYNLSDKREILRVDQQEIRAIYATDNRMLYTAIDAIPADAPINVITQLIDVNTMKVLLESDERFPDEGCLSPDAKGAYLLLITDDFDGIAYYDFATQEYTPVVQTDYEAIANFRMMNHSK